MSNRGWSIIAVGRTATLAAHRLFLLALLAALFLSPARAQIKPFDFWAPASATEAKEIEDFLKNYFNASAPLDFASIDALATKLGAPGPVCRNAVCVQTDCVVTNDSHQKAVLLLEVLRDMDPWLVRAYTLLVDHYMQLVRETDRKYDYKADVIDVALKKMTLLHEGGKYLLLAADIASFIENWAGNIDKLKAGERAVDSKIVALGTIIDRLLEILNQAGNLLELEEAIRVKMVALTMPVPSWMSNIGTAISFINDAKGVLQGLKASMTVWGDSASRLSGLRQARISVGQIIGKLLLIWSQREIDDMRRLVEGNDGLMENYLTIIAAEGAFNSEVFKAAQRLKRIVDPMGRTIARLNNAVTDAGHCLKSCSPGQPLRNPPVNFHAYADALPYYQARVKLLTRQLATGLSVYLATPIDPTDPNAPEMCRQLASPDDDQLAGLVPPKLEFPPVPVLPARFCSLEERLDFDKNILTPAAETARRSWNAATSYTREIGGRLQKVKNALDKGGPNTALERQRRDLEAADAAYAPIYADATAKFQAFSSLIPQYLNTPVEECEPPVPFQITIPEVPDSFCSENERMEMVAELGALLDEARKQGQAWRNYRLELVTRGNNTGDATLKASLSKQMTDFQEISDRIAQMIGDLERLLEKTNTVPVGECIDPCLIGSWEATSVTHSLPVVNPGEAGIGFRVAFKADGTETVDYANIKPFLFDSGHANRRDKWTFGGMATGRISTRDHVAKIESTEGPTATYTLDLEAMGAPRDLRIDLRAGPAALGSTADDNKYVCTEESLEYRGSFDPDRHATLSFKLTRLN